MTAELALALLVVVVLVVWLALARANRIDLLHQKVTRTGGTLDAQLLRRAGLAAELAGSGELDPASALIVADSASACLEEAREADLEALASERSGARRELGRATLTPEREVVESELSRVLRQALDPEASDQLTADVLAAWRRVQLARRFHNETVLQVRRIRMQPTVRLFRLAGTAPLPRTFEMDDAMEELRATRG